MSCTNCYTTNSAAPCGTVGCLSTNYSKCIIYSGNNLYCQTGTIETVNFSGVAVSPVSDTTVTVSCTGGTGSGATFSVTRLAGFTTYTVSIVNKGLGYTVGDVLTILGTSLGGTSSNNILVVVSGLTPIISNSDSVDEIILNLHQRLCLTSTAGLDYSTFNYSCLRVGGNLTGIGTTITTAQTFTEATAAALCALNTRVIAVEKPALTVPACFSGTITSGTTGLASILTQYGALLCTHSTNLDLSAVTANPCVGYAFTSKPTSNNVREYVDWITTNMCGMFTTNNGLILAQTAKVNALYTYITGSTSGSVPASVDTSCLSGGSLTSNLKDAIVLIKNNLCSLNTTVAGLGGATNLTVSWSGCFTSPYTAGSIFNVQSLGSFTNTTNLQTHLNQIASALSALNIKFDSTYFTVAYSACGPIVSLATGGAFTCAALASCSIGSLGDVDITGIVAGDILKWNGSGFFPYTDPGVSVYPINTSGTYAGGAITIVANTYYSLSVPTLRKEGTTVALDGILQLLAGTTYSWTPGNVLNLSNTISGSYLSGTRVQNLGPVFIEKRLAGSPILPTAIYNGMLSLINDKISVYNIGTSTISLAAGDILTIAIGGKSWII